MDIENFYDKENNTMFKDIKLTQKGCELMIKACKDKNNIIELLKNTGSHVFEHYFISNPATKHDNVKHLCRGVSIRYLGKEFLDWSKDKFPDDDFDNKMYREKCKEFLIECGYFIEEEIEKVVRKLGHRTMGGQYTVTWAFSELLGEDEN